MKRSNRLPHRFMTLLLVISLLLPQMAAPQPADAAAPAARAQMKNRAAPERSLLSVFFADLNGDRQVDANDLRRAAEGWNCATGDACYSAELDRDGNGVIDALDLAAIANEFDVTAPQIAITSPADGAVVSGGSVRVEGTVADSHSISAVTVNGVAAAVTDGSFAVDVPAEEGAFVIDASASDALGLPGNDSVLVIRDAEGPFIAVAQPGNRQAVYTRRPTVQISYSDLVAEVDPGTLRVTLADENGGVRDISGQMSADGAGASGAPAADLQSDESYTLTVSVRDTNGVESTHTTSFYVPANPESLTPPAAAENAGFVSGRVFDSSTCGGTQQFDPINCTGLPGALVTLERVDEGALQAARLARQADLNRARSRFGLPHQASRAPVAVRAAVEGTIVTGPDGFFAFPVAQTGSYEVRVKKDGFTYSQRLTDIVLARSTPTTDIFLTPLDPAVTPCDAAGCQHASSDGQMELDVPAGAIAGGQSLDIRATAFDQVQYLPSGDLPPGTAETYAFNLSGASEITFTVPVTVRQKNRRGFAPGTPIPLGYWNQDLLVWEHAGQGIVTADGEWVETQVTHFSNFDLNFPRTSETVAVSGEDKTAQSGENCKADCDSSQVEIASGALRQEFGIPSVNVLGEEMDVTLLYDSQRANANAVIDLELSLASLVAQDLSSIDLIFAELFIEGESTETFTFRVGDLEADGEIGRFRFFWDGRDAQGQRMPPGVYFYDVRVRLPFETQFFQPLNGTFGGPPDPTQPTGVSTTGFVDRTFNGSVVLNHDVAGHYGQGWQVADVQRLHISENGIALIDDGNFVPTEYQLPAFNLLNSGTAVRLGARELAGMAERTTNDERPTPGEFATSESRDAAAEFLTEADNWLESADPAENPAQQPPPPAARAIATDVTADITADTVWSVANSPYRLLNDITVAASAILTVEAGVRVEGIGTGSSFPVIFVDGELRSLGTAAAGVIFTSRDDDNNPIWGGIRVQNGGTATLHYTQIRFAGQAPGTLGREASLAVVGSTATLSETLIFDSINFDNDPDACLHISSSSVTLNAVTLDGCGSVGAEDRAALDVLGGGTAIAATGGLTISNSSRYPVATQWDLLDELPAITTDGSGVDAVRVLNSGINEDLTVAPVGTLDTIQFDQDVTIDAGRQVTATAGIKLAARSSDNDIIVRGMLTAQGTGAQPVVFTSDDDDPTGNGGGEWGGILVDGGAALFDFTTIRFAGNLRLPDGSRNAALAVLNGTLRLRDSTLLHNNDTDPRDDASVYSENSDTVIERSLINNDLFQANPKQGIEVVGGGSFALRASEVRHRLTPLRLPLVHLSGVAADNTFVTSQPDPRIELTGSTLTTDLTVAPFPGLGAFHTFGTLAVEAGATLTLAAGTTLRAQTGDSDLIVRGGLVAQGTQAQNVVLTSQTDSGPAQWGGVLIDGGTAQLDFTTLRFAGALSIPISQQTRINTALAVINRGDLRLTNSTLFQNGDTSADEDGYLFVEDSTAFVQNSVLTDDGLNRANPSHGVIVRDGGNLDFTFANNVLVQKSRLIEAPLDVLQSIGGNNVFSSDGDQRFVISDPTIAGDVTLGAIGGIDRYELKQAVTVNGALTLAPGVDLLMRFGALTIDGGALIAAGTAEAPITFDVVVNAWKGIDLLNGAEGRFDHVSVQNATADSGIESNGGSLSIRNSTFSGNRHGVRVFGDGPEQLLLRGNLFDGNTSFGVLNSTGATIDGRFNAWGDPSGPTHPSNPGGTGDAASANVLVVPFLGGGGDGNNAINLTPHDTTVLHRDPATGEFIRTYPDGSQVIFNAAGLHTATRDTNGNEIRYSYNPDGSLTTIGFVANGRADADWTWTFTYDDGRRTTDDRSTPTSDRPSSVVGGQITITDPAGRVTTLTIDKNGNLAEWQEPGLDAPMRFTYGGQNNLVLKQDARGFFTRYRYDENNRITQTILPKREVFDPVTGDFRMAFEVHDFAPAASNGPTVNALDPGSPDAPNGPLPKSLSLVSAQQVNGDPVQTQTNEFGAPIGSTDPFGNQTQYERDERDNVTKMTFPSGICTEFTYNEVDNMTSETLLAADQCDLPEAARDPARMLRTVNTFENRFNKTKSTTDALGRTTTFVYDYEVEAGDAGNLVQVIFPPVEDGESPARAVVTPVEQYEYNAFGQVTRHVDVRGMATCFEYTTGDGGEAGTLFADGVTPVPGLLTKEIEDCGALERSFIYREFNAAGTALTEIEYVGTQQERTTTTSTDARNRAISVTDPLGNVTQNDFDNGDNLIRETMTGHDGRVLITEYTYNPEDAVTQIADIGDDGQTRSLGFGYDLDRNETLSQDFNGNQERSVYDANDRLVRAIDAAGKEMTVTYDADGRQLTTTDARGSVTRYQYDAFGRRAGQITDVGGLNLTVQIEQDPVGNQIRFVDALGTVTCFEYDSFDRETRVIEDCGGLNKTTDTAYSLSGDPTLTTDALGRSRAIRYDALGRAVTFTDPLGNSATMAYDSADNPITTTDEVGQSLQMAYDFVGRLTQTTNALGGTTAYSYDSFDNILAQTDELGRTYQYEYDGFNRRNGVIDPLGNRSEYEYDGNNNTRRLTDPRGMTTHYTVNAFDLVTHIAKADGSTLALEYDPNLNKVREVDGFGSARIFTYDAADRLIARTDRDGAQMTYEFDAAGNLLAEIDPLGNATRQTFDGLYRVVQLDRANGETVTYTYDLVGNLLALADGVGNTTSYSYDALNRQLTETNEMGQTRTSAYAADGKLIRFVDRNGNDFTFTYDGLRRLTLETEANSGQTRSMSYDAASQLIGAQDANSQYVVTFDSRGDATSVEGTFTTGAPTVRYDYTPDAAGNVVRRVEQVNGATTGTTDFTYDEMERMTRMVQQTGLTQRVEMAYDANGRMTQLDRFHNGAAAVSSIYTYAPDDFIASLTHTTDSLTRSFTYGYDAHNRITAKTTQEGQSSYGYDSRDQVTAATHDFQADESYSYDDNGNRTLPGHVTGADNRLQSDGTFNYQYDAEGNRTRQTNTATGETVEYEWDHLNRLVGVVRQDAGGAAVQTVRFTYDVFNHRISKTVDGVAEHYAYDGPNLTLVLDDAGTVTSRYLFGNQVDMLLAEERGGTTRWLLAEANRSISDVLDSGGTLLNHITYDSFGNVTAQTDASQGVRWGFTGRERDSETGLTYFRTRYYDEAIGRFISQDRLGFAGGDTNLYRYAGNDSVNDTDPFGTSPGSIRSIGEGISQARQQALANNVRPMTKPVQRGWMDSLYNFALDTTIFLTDNAVVNSADQFVSGQSSQLTFGLTDTLREKMYGEHATKNHTGGFRTAGELFGFAQSFFLPGANAANLAKVRALVQSGSKGRATLLALAQLLSTNQLVQGGLTLQDRINQVLNDPCLSEEEKSQKLLELIGNSRMPQVRTPQNSGSNQPPPSLIKKALKKGQNKKNKSPLEKTRQRNKERAKEELRKHKDEKQFKEAQKEYQKQKAKDQQYEKDLKDYLRKRSMELRRKELLNDKRGIQKKAEQGARNEAKQKVDQEVQEGNISRQGGDRLKKDIDSTSSQDLADTDIRQEARARGRIEQQQRIEQQRERERQFSINPNEDTGGGGGGGFDFTVPGLGGGSGG